MSCHYCDNATTNPSLTPDTDLSYYGIGMAEQGTAIRFRSGDNRPTAIVIDRWDETTQRNVQIGLYVPKFCPECGRYLRENERM